MLWFGLHGAAPALAAPKGAAGFARGHPSPLVGARVFAGSWREHWEHWVPGGIASRGSMREVLPAALSRAVEYHPRLFWYRNKQTCS